ncbi:hypothetical protein [Candidatus Uabimicrobium amorphum]|uniref:Uncharacterized protein n=1 Tax=Uabimicrobium amorphum TaxID=2596890 RepID=A0A5S9ITC4_UABAM|nr:hypothetical protein [Candidatus Uabimicrobium amorphum]BBM87190.1 hypothetical protein UABAM_05593 [Candidatus Uabimicrobium amorphum]
MKIILLLISFCVLCSAQFDNLDDAVVRAILKDGTPRTIFEVQQKLEDAGGVLKPHIVANRGHDNPRFGSFSVFHTYTGPMQGGVVQEEELFIGFFTTQRQGVITTLQSFQSSLMIEIIAWDYTKKMYNFWELVGNGGSSEWHYRGDSQDVAADVEQINMGNKAAKFGQRLRCSGCHTLGGPILKEIEAPHNDWWNNNDKLNLGTLRLNFGSDPQNPEHFAARMFFEAEDVSNLSKQVKKGIDRLVAAREGNLHEQMRSLVSTMEMNLASDTKPLQAKSQIAIPKGFFVDERLLGKSAPQITIDTALYMQALQTVQSRFAQNETPGLIDARHAFLVPTRSYIDNKVIDVLLHKGILDEELIADILAIDFTNPVYSQKRKNLIRYIPKNAINAQHLREQLIANLQNTNETGAKELLSNLTDPRRNKEFHRKQALAFFDVCQQKGNVFVTVMNWVKIATQRRVEIQSSQPAQNPRGTILEPGFRVIFPQNNIATSAGKWFLNPVNGNLEINNK